MKSLTRTYGIASAALICSVASFDVMAQNVGVGTSTPAEKLHIVGSVRSSSLAGAGNREVLADPNGTLIIGNGAIAPDWTLLGNANAATGTNFLGTTNAIRLDFRTNSVIRQSTLPTGQVYLNDAVGINNAIFTSYAGAPTATNIGVDGQGSSLGVLGIGGIGVQGQTNSVNDGVFGLNQNTGNSGAANGVFGWNQGTAGVGVTGQGATGVLGLNAGGTYYVAGTAGLSAGTGASGHATGASGTGGFFRASGGSPQPFAVLGTADNAAATDAVGVFGNTANSGGIGVVGTSLNGTYYNPPTPGCGVEGAGTQLGVFGIATLNGNDRAGGYFLLNGTAGWAYVGGRQGPGAGTFRKIWGSGSVSTVVKDVNNQMVLLMAPEAPENLFMDYGTGQLSNGICHIDLDPNLSKNIIVNEQHPLRVFIQLEGDCNGVYVTNKTGNGFDVVELGGGISNTPFTYEVVANRADEDAGDGTISAYSAERWPICTMGPKGVIERNINERINNIKTGTNKGAEGSGRVPLKEGEMPSE